MRMHVYDIGKDNNTSGLIELPDYIRLIRRRPVMKDFEKYLAKCLMEIKSLKSTWDGSIISVRAMSIGFIFNGKEVNKMIVFSDDNDHEYLISEYHVKELSQKYLNTQKPFNQADLFKWFDESIDMVTYLIDEYDEYMRGLDFKDIRSNDKIINKNENTENNFEQIG